MRKELMAGLAALAVVGVALAQVEASSSGVALAQVEASNTTYFVDVDPARYNGPPVQRLVMQVGDQPRRLTLDSKDEICVQLRRAPSDSTAISAHVRVLKPEPHDATEVKVAGPGISPGTYRSTPWGMLLRVVPEKKATLEPVRALGMSDAPVCSL